MTHASSPKNILYIEDDKGLARLMQKKLKRQNYHVETAENSDLGIQLLKQNQYDLLLIDFNLPNKNGLQTIRELIDQGICLPIIMVTGGGNEKIAVEVMKLGVGDYIIKDTNGHYFELLPSLIDRLLEQQQLRLQKENAEIRLSASEERFRTIADFTYDWEEWRLPDGRCEYVSPSCERVSGYTPQEFYNNHALMLELVSKPDHDRLLQHSQDCFEKADTPPAYIEFKIICKNGEERWIGRNCQSVVTDDGRWLGQRASNRDITQNKKAEEQLRILSLYDSLTGLYNRNYYEQELTRLQNGRDLPLGIIVCDIDGLKIINDTLGHLHGDELIKQAGSIIKSAFRENDVVARIGGDEFVVVIPHCDATSIANNVNRIKEKIHNINNTPEVLPISISIGIAITEKMPLNLSSLYKKADDMMYRDKNNHRQRFLQCIFNFMSTTYKKYKPNHQQCADKIKTLLQKMINTIEIEPKAQAKLELLSKYYDIGNVGIPVELFTKTGALSKEEEKTMHLHCEIGERLANFFPELRPISRHILLHHKHWDGNGYPDTKPDERIPFINGILAIVVAYTSMTTQQTFHQAFSHDEAITELRRCSGSQFNPELVDTFITLFP